MMAAKKKVKTENTSEVLASTRTNSLELAAETSSEIVIPIAEEHLQVSKRQVVAGKVRLHKTVEERLATVSLPLERETVEVRRVPIGQVLTQPRQPRQEGDTLIVPIFEEVLVVEKRFRLVEEVHITTTKTERNEVQHVKVRRERVRLERDGEEIELKGKEESSAA
jgi:uncharacterized protein (TIGR02271 family)